MLSYEELYGDVGLPPAREDADAANFPSQETRKVGHQRHQDDEDRGRSDPEWQPVLRMVADVAPVPLSWLWRGRIPLGKVTLLDGDPGVGKSSLTTWLAAKVSTGSPLPGGERLPGPAGVVLLSAEDGVADTIRQRLEAAGANLHCVAVLTEVTDAEGRSRLPTLPGDIPALERAIEQVGARLVVIDPLMAYLHGSVNTYRDQDVRRALHPLALLAERTGVAILVVRHLNKSSATVAIYRGGGSIAIAGAARSVLLAAVHPDDKTRRVLAVVKSNLAERPPALVYRLVSDDEFGCAVVQWDGVADFTADDLLMGTAPDDSGPSAVDIASDVLRELLCSGPRPAKEVEADMREAGIALRTYRRARGRLGVKPSKVGRPGADGQQWVLSLPPGAQSQLVEDGHPIAEVDHSWDVDTFDGDGHLRVPKPQHPSEPKRKPLELWDGEIASACPGDAS